MNRPAMAAAFLLLAITVCLGQDTPAPQASAPPAAGAEAGEPSAVRGTIPVSLAKSVDSKKLKEGDEIDAKTVAALRTSTGVMIPAGSKVVGHVTVSKARSKGDSDSSLGIMFDKIQVPGKDLPIKGVMQAVGPNPEASSGPDTGAAGGGTMAAHGGDPSTMASPVSGAGAPLGSKLGQGGGGKMLSGQSTGVVGIKNMQLDNSVLTSTGKEVKLDQGSQIMVKAE
jgi:hypothetical protein